ncbi:MAG: ATP-binding cassette domain-containing protein [Clostridiales bacterium]|nr:ATP-binding cassette domain-containing protein [Clostridiales bacterium]
MKIKRESKRKNDINYIEFTGVSKTYKVKTSEKGLKSAISGLFNPQYKYVNAVKDINLKVEKGETIGLIGLNGAGKTTTLKMLSGLIHPSEGKINAYGHNPWKKEKSFLKKIGLISGMKNQLWLDIPAIDSFEIEKAIYKIDEKDYISRLDYLVAAFNVENLLNIPVRKLSLGEKMKMELILVLLHNPEILLLDEPTIGLDIIAQENLRNMLEKYKTDNYCTTIITSHNMKDIESICERVLLIHNGSIVYDGTINQLKKQMCSKVVIIENVPITQLTDYGKVKKINGKVGMLVEDPKVKELIDDLENKFTGIKLRIEDVDFEEAVSAFIS